MSTSSRPIRLRREPPPLRVLSLRRRRLLGPRLVRVTVGGPALAGFEMPDPAGSVRLLLPEPGAAEFELPEWNGNEYLRSDGSRPVLRTLTPRHHRPEADELDVDVVLHGDAPLPTWAADAEPDSPVAVSGPGRGLRVDPAVGSFVLVGDESAVPAIGQLLEALPASARATVLVEVADPSGRSPLPDRPGIDVTWLDRDSDAEPGTAMEDAIRTVSIAEDAHVWVAGEARAVQAIRGLLFEERGRSRSLTTVRGYWKNRTDTTHPGDPSHSG